MPKFKYVPLIILLLYGFISCNTTEPPNSKGAVLSLEDVSCTEAWLRLSTTNLQLPTTVTIVQDGKTKETVNLVKNDTTIYVDSLLPNQTYKFKVSSNENPVSSNEVNATTLDTTSNDFTWQTWTFGGQAGSCTLYDVTLINDNDIWAVGEINIADTSQNGYTTYNALHWDGSEWKLSRLYFYTFCGQPGEGSYPTKSIIAFDENDIWITSGSQITHYDGEKQLSTECIPVSVNKLWGIDDDNLYAVGVGGKIAYYHNGMFNKIVSGTTTNINDVWGVTSIDNNPTKVYCAVSFLYQSGDRKIITINNTGKVDSIGWRTGKRVNTVWTNNLNFIYAAGDGIFNNKTGQLKEESGLPNYYIRRVRGTGLNDIYAAGDYGFFAHYSGTRWKAFPELSMQGIFMGLDVKKDKVVLVGLKGEQAIIVVGQRN